MALNLQWMTGRDRRPVPRDELIGVRSFIDDPAALDELMDGSGYKHNISRVGPSTSMSTALGEMMVFPADFRIWRTSNQRNTRDSAAIAIARIDHVVGFIQSLLFLLFAILSLDDGGG